VKHNSDISKDEKNRHFFNKWSKDYDSGRIAEWFKYTQKITIDQLSISPGSNVLDVGCGTGHAVRHLSELPEVNKAFGIDISPGMIGQAKAATAKEYFHKVEFIESSSENLPFSNNELDHIICTSSFHHYPKPLEVLGEMKRVLKPNGQLVIFESATDLSFYTFLWDRFLRIFEAGHVQYYTTKELHSLLEKAQLHSIECRYLKNEFLKHGKLFTSVQVWSAKVGT